MNPNLIPAVDPAGLPGPVWLFQILLVFTFFLHLLFMNLTLGGGLLAAIAHTLSGGRAEDPRGVLAHRLVAMNGYGISLTITTGIAPLLFMQVLYHQFFYPATILIGGMWFALLGFLMVGYYAVYVYKFKGAPSKNQGGGVWLWIAAVLFLVIAGIQVAVHLIHAQPGQWRQIAASGWSILGDPTYFPRLLHFVFAAVAFTALIVTWWAVRQAGRGVEVETNRAIAGWAWKWALWTTALQVVDGFVLTFVLPKEVLLGLMRGGGATMVPFTLAIVLAIGLLMMMARTADPVEKPPLVNGVLGTAVGLIALMAVTRDQIRSLYLGSAVDLGTFSVRPQWFNFVLFAVLLIIGLVTVFFMIRTILGSPATGDDAA